MTKIFRNIMVGLLCMFTIISSGFGMWFFITNSEDVDGVNTIGGLVDVKASAMCGEVDFISPLADGFSQYNILFGTKQSDAELQDSEIVFLPSIKFIFSNYIDVAEDFDFYFYTTFETTSNMFCESDEDADGYGIFLTSAEGQSVANMIKIEVQDGLGQYKVKEDEHGNPILDEENNPIYETEVEFTPLFRYRTNAKPATVEEYELLVQDLMSDTGSSTITFHIVTVEK